MNRMQIVLSMRKYQEVNVFVKNVCYFSVMLFTEVTQNVSTLISGHG